MHCGPSLEELRTCLICVVTATYDGQPTSSGSSTDQLIRRQCSVSLATAPLLVLASHHEMSSDASRLDTFLATQATFRQPERLQFLYSDFSYRRQSNPQGFDGAVTWWKQFLTALAIAGLQREDETAADNDHLVLRLDTELLDRLKRPGIGRPAALGSVMVRLAMRSAAPLG